MPPDVGTQGLDAVRSKRRKTDGNTSSIENVVCSPESQGRLHSHVSRPIQRRMTLPRSTIDAVVTPDDYRRLQTLYNISEESLKNAWEVCRRQDAFDVFNSYSHKDLQDVSSVFQCDATRQLFEKIHQSAGVGRGHSQATGSIDRDSGFCSSASTCSFPTNLAASRQPSLPPANSFMESPLQQGIERIEPSFDDTGWPGIATHPTGGQYAGSYGNFGNPEARPSFEPNATAADLPRRGYNYRPMHLSSRPALIPINSSHTSVMATRTGTTTNMRYGTSARALIASQAAPTSDRIRIPAYATPHTQPNTATSGGPSNRTQEIEHECTHCTMTFKSVGHRNRHHEHKHDALYIYECKKCPSNAKHYDSAISIRRHLAQAHSDQTSDDARHPERHRYRPPNIAMACGLCGELFRRSDWTAKATSADKTRRARQRPGSTRSSKSMEFQRDEQEDSINQGFLEDVWYNHIAIAHQSNLSGWSKQVMVNAFIRQDELRSLFEFATSSPLTSLQSTEEVVATDHWDKVLDRHIEDGALWPEILEQLEFRSLSASEGEAKKTIELCLGLVQFDWTPFDSWKDPMQESLLDMMDLFPVPPTFGRDISIPVNQALLCTDMDLDIPDIDNMDWNETEIDTG